MYCSGALLSVLFIEIKSKRDRKSNPSYPGSLPQLTNRVNKYWSASWSEIEGWIIFIYNWIKAVLFLSNLCYMLFSLLITKLVRATLLIFLERKVVLFCFLNVAWINKSTCMSNRKKDDCYKNIMGYQD